MAQDHAFEPIQVKEAVTGRIGDSVDDGLARIFADGPQQLAQGKREITVTTLFECGQIVREFRSGPENRKFFRMGIIAFDALATRRRVLGSGDPLVSAVSYA